MMLDSMDAKTALNQFCQRYCSRPVTKNDIVYTTTKFGSNQYQAIVKLNCLEGQEYAGELAANPKEAEKSAAAQALQAYQSVMNTLPPLAASAQKKKRPPTQVGVGGGMAQPAMVSLGAGMGMGGISGVPGQLVMPPVAAEVVKRKPPVDGENPALTDKVKLNAACMKIAKRALQKGETVYESQQMGTGKTPSGYRATVRLLCLPEEWNMKIFVGQVSANKQGAEQSAASAALAAIMADPELGAAAAKASQGSPKNAGKPRKAGGSTTGKGNGKGARGWGSRGWGWAPPSGPDLPRDRVLQERISGEVVEWKGSFGWLKPAIDIEHASAGKRGGKVYVHQQDIGSAQSLTEGSTVNFYVYSDSSGLGAEEVVAL